ncbi:Protein kinase-like domain protein [Akanthomyces lecanii RCEF 1005]|uniref:non-specific serine/threonine protein kinase n=1 Tax=Akanthomyces lecanii RCEF 1005 TaxID=1081108 RepID=A0A168KVJ5_CORDF|nr:Protein kinase-like domain protein [Akanthomyces lecanii RCEF 1005]
MNIPINKNLPTTPSSSLSPSTPSVPPTTSLKRKRSHLTIADVKDGYTTRPVSNLLWNQEFLTCYGSNGCHPVCIGDTFKNGRYKVIRKLGYGSSSTVWLAQDTSTDTLVALKIHIAHESGSTSRREVTALEALHPNKDTSKLFPVLCDDFVHNGPNCAHRCIVMQVLGPSLRLVIESYYDERIDPEDLLRLARQVLEATATLHEAGFAHRDLDADNIVFSFRNMAKLSRKAFIKKLGKLETAELLRVDGSPPDDYLPKQLVGAAEWDGWIDEDEEDIRFIDAGESFRVGDRISSTRDANPTTTELETDFKERVPEPQLAVLLPVLQGLMRFRPEDRVSARDALALLDQGNSKDASGSSGADESSGAKESSNEAELSSEEESSSERE